MPDERTPDGRMNDRPAPDHAETVLEADIVRTLPGFSLALRLDVRREILVLFGPSGSGKSRTLQALAGLDRPDGGRIVMRSPQGGAEVFFDAEQRRDVRPQDRRVGYVPQSLGLFPHLTVAQNVTYGLRDRPRRERDETGRRLLSLMQLHGLADRRPSQLSGGQRQRVALARALAVEPRLLLLDEPFTALDGPTRRALGDELRTLQQARGIPVVLVTHDIDEAFALADRIAVIDAGRLLQVGDRRDVFARPASRRVAELVGIANLLPGVVRGPAPQGGVIVEWGPIALHVGGAAVDRAVAPGAAVDLAVAASTIMVLKPDADPPARAAAPSTEPGGPDAEGRPNVIECRLLRTEMGRETIRLDVQPLAGAALSPLRLEIPAYAYYRLELDQRARFAVQLKPDQLHLIPRAEAPTPPAQPARGDNGAPPAAGRIRMMTGKSV